MVRPGSAKALFAGSIPARASFVFDWQNLEASDLWYLIGLITADGSLSKDGRHIDLTSKNREHLNTIKSKLEIPNKIGQKTNGRQGIAYRIQMGSIGFHRFLQSVGLFPNKTHTLEKVFVPTDHFPEFLRGLFDGDGSIRTWEKNESSQSQVYCKITASSKPFLQWIQSELQMNHKIFSTIHPEKYKTGSGYVLKVSRKSDVRAFLELCYQDANVYLSTKYQKALSVLNSN